MQMKKGDSLKVALTFSLLYANYDMQHDKK